MKGMASEIEDLFRKASAAKSLLSRRYNEMEEHRRNSTSTFEDYLTAVDVYKEQEEIFQAAVSAWREACEPAAAIRQESTDAEK